MDGQKNKYIVYHIEKGVARLTFNRPEVHNAFHADLINEACEAVRQAKEDPSVRVLVITGAGKSFCAGADLNWMREIIHYSFEQNLEESLKIAEVMHSIYSLPKPVVAMVNGAAIGGGTGFVAACDIAVAAEEAVFSLSEVKIGLVPAAISPYVIRKIGERNAREYFLTGKRIPALQAREIGLVNTVVSREELEQSVEDIVRRLLSSGPEAIAKCKELIQRVPGMDWEEVKDFTARMIAGLRISEEGQEGMAAFLKKRKPSWIKDSGEK
ncbi:MAG: enoyl-CoA hydratase/isomerase family protein [Candidatus Aminicenantes bacterium]|nr:enoyl-CoA hydratase/isomerase family protein [Candidatus Aminicenantes bacterium]